VVTATTGVADKATPTVPAAWRPAEVHFLDRAQGTLALAVRPSRLHDVAPAEVALLRLPAPITERTAQAALAGSFDAATASAAVQRLIERGLLDPQLIFRC